MFQSNICVLRSKQPTRFTKGAADPNIRIGTLSGYDQNTPLPLKDPKAQCYASAHPCIAVHGASSVRVRLPPPERCAGRRP